MAFELATAAHHAGRRGGDAMHPRRAVPRVDSVTLSGLVVIVWSCIFLQRFGVSLGASEVPAAFIAAYLVFLVLLCRGRLVVNTSLLALFMITMACMTVSLIVSATKASLMSYVYLLSIYGLYIFKLKYPAGCFRRVLSAFLDMMAVCAAFGVAQFALQFVLNPDFVFPLDTFMPDSILLKGYNVIIPLEYLSSTLKSNGVFFLEPSFFSQFLAVAVIIELVGAQRGWRLLLYAAAMILSYSGTGLILVFLFLPWTLMKRSSAGLVVTGFVLVAALVLFSGVIDLEALVDRVGEFSSTESSGFARFISPYFLMRDFLIVSPGKLLFGLGPGAIEGVEQKATSLAYLAHDPTWIKLVLEYGLVAATIFMIFVAAALFQGTRNRIMSWSILCLYLFLGGYLLSGFMNCLFVALLAWHSRTVPARLPAGRVDRRRVPPTRRYPPRAPPVAAR